MNPEPRWQPISALPELAGIIDGMLRDSQEEHQRLLEARPRAHELDDYTVSQVVRAFTDQAKTLGIYEQQLDRWLRFGLQSDQAYEVDRLKAQLGRLATLSANILALAEDVKQGTIERMLEKNDAEVGLESLGKGKL